ncbi:MAG: sigma-70 family RNA polymerase sigma factor [Ruminococcus sp.]|nr:sigma-70 family RNA polymerase sigma factor [Ruminococcus sp.]
MTKTECGRLLTENLGKLYGWAFSRVYNKDEAEDLTNDIICAVLSSVGSLKNDGAFYGFMWRTAENILGSRIRRRQRENALFDKQSEYMGVCLITPETDIEEKEQLSLLRRELSRLSGLYRQTAVLRYFRSKSSKEISQLLNISPEMVRWYLFRSREILKEGIDMTRNLGEKSFDPATFRLDFFGENSSGYWEMFERRLPGNILLAAYEKPLTVSELSDELGVSAPYLEDELAPLVKHGFLKESAGHYNTDIIIFTDEYEKNAAARFKPLCKAAAQRVNGVIEAALEKVGRMDFHRPGISRDTLKFVLANIAVYHGMIKADGTGRGKYGDYPPLSNGSCGYLFGYDNDYANHHFNGIYGRMEDLDGTCYVSVVNYRAIENVQKLTAEKWRETAAALTGAAKGGKADENSDVQLKLAEEGYITVTDGRLTANFCVFPEKLLQEEILPLLDEAVTETFTCTEKVCAEAENMLLPLTPSPLQAKCGALTRIRYQLDVMAFIVESCLEEGYLQMPEKESKPAMFGVVRG